MNRPVTPPEDGDGPPASGYGGAIVRRPGHPTVRSKPVCLPGATESVTPCWPGEAGPELFTTCSVDDCDRPAVPPGDTCGGHP